MAERKQMRIDDYIAGIVLYNPDIARLEKNIDAIHEQVKKVYCFNNGSINLHEINELLDKYENVILIEGNGNSGIPAALNRMVQIADAQGAKWFLALDQDSVCPNGMMEAFDQVSDKEKIGIICPFMFDSRRPCTQKPKEKYTEVDFCITSGSLFNIDIYINIGGSDEYLFIGLVDNEYCFRLLKAGYKILQVNDMVLDHELGDLKQSRFSSFYLKLGDIFHSTKIQALSYKRYVSPLRVYYATRNIVYLSNKYSREKNYKFSKRFAIENGLSSILRGQDKIKIIKAFLKGFIAGYKVNVL